MDIEKRQRSLLDSTGLRLRLLGLSDEQINELEQRQKPDESLIYPSEEKAWLLADVYEQDLGIIKPGQAVRVDLKRYAGELWGRVYAIEQVDSFDHVNLLFSEPQVVLGEEAVECLAPLSQKRDSLDFGRTGVSRKALR